LTAGDDVEDEDEEIAMPKPSTIATRRGVGRRRPARHFVEGSLFYLEDKFSADFLQMQEAESRRVIRG
jgi:hypothetical protein